MTAEALRPLKNAVFSDILSDLSGSLRLIPPSGGPPSGLPLRASLSRIRSVQRLTLPPIEWLPFSDSALLIASQRVPAFQKSAVIRVKVRWVRASGGPLQKRGQVPHFNKMPANFREMAMAGHAKGVAMPICGSGLPSAFATGYGGTSLMARGEGGKVVFGNDGDRYGFLFRLAKVCVSHGWRVHAWVLMRQLEKVLVAALLRERTAVGNPWIAQRLAMGNSGSVSRLVVVCGKSVTQTGELEKLKKMLKCDTGPNL